MIFNQRMYCEIRSHSGYDQLDKRAHFLDESACRRCLFWPVSSSWEVGWIASDAARESDYRESPTSHVLSDYISTYCNCEGWVETTTRPVMNNVRGKDCKQCWYKFKGKLQSVAPRGFPGKGVWDSVRSRTPVVTCLLMRMVRRKKKGKTQRKDLILWYCEINRRWCWGRLALCLPWPYYHIAPQSRWWLEWLE